MLVKETAVGQESNVGILSNYSYTLLHHLMGL